MKLSRWRERWSQIAVAGLLGSSIAMVGMATETLNITPLSKEHDVKVVLDQEAHHFSVHGGCNTLMGQVYLKDNGAFRVKEGRAGAALASTMMACDPELQKLDERISQFMISTPKMVREGDALYLVGTVPGEKSSHYLPVELDQGEYLDIKAKPYERVFYYISAERTPCEEQEAGCLQVREDKNSEWEIYTGEIEGFTPVENYEYRLRLKEYQSEDGAAKHVLDMIVEQGEVVPVGHPSEDGSNTQQ